jgi:hypothetical protein
MHALVVLFSIHLGFHVAVHYQFHGSRRLLVGWTAIPCLVLFRLFLDCYLLMAAGGLCVWWLEAKMV